MVAVGVGLRLCSFSPFWLDETQSVQFAHLPLRELQAGLRTDGAPPLYYVLLHVWMQLFGTGVWAVRSMSMLASIVSLPLAWRVARRLGGSRELPTVVLALLATSPWAIRYAGEARMYSSVVLEVLLGILALERLRRRADKLSLLAVGVLTAALLLTHYWAIWLLANVAGVLVFVAWRRPAERRFVARAGLAAGCGVLAFLPWVPTMLYQSKHTGAPWADTPDLGALAELPIDWFGGTGPAGMCASLLVTPLLIVAVFGRRTAAGSLLFAGRPGSRVGLLASLIMSTLLTALTAAVVTHSTVATRYTAVVVPLVMLLMGVGVTRLPRTAGHVVLAILLAIGVAGGITAATTPHSQAGEIADLLNQDAGYGDLIVYCPDQLAPSIETRLHVLGVTRIELPAEKNPYVIDWTDYTSRLADFNPQATARSITSYLKTQDAAAVWFVSAWGYRTHTAVCGPLRDRLSAALGPPTLMHDSDARGYEKASLERFGGPKH
ncbi:MAG TPA: glycosyltransferase family 39 protein [Sporichthyaceae bacterium]|jgi:uncharacterized membrane protein|nr:glycosyltransferase family 39 protein [Sporichthyaceae bacterium]